MNDLPLHPALVHLPLGLAAIAPLAAAGLGLAVWRGALPKRAWAAVVALQALLLLGGVAALKTGEQEEERVEHRVGERAIKQHEELAERFVWASGVTLALGAGALAVTAPGAAAGLMLATTLATGVTAGFGYQTGHAGGALVYGAGGLAPAGGGGGGEGGEAGADGGAGGERDDDD